MRRFLVPILLAVSLFPFSSPLQAQDREFVAGEIVIVTAARVSMRSKPGMQANVVRTLFQGDELRIEDMNPETVDSTTWWKVTVIGGGRTGWVPESSIASTQSDPTDETTASACWTDDQFVEVDGNPNWTDPPAMVIDLEQDYVATISTSEGEIVVEMDAANAPIATNNFYCPTSASITTEPSSPYL